MDRRRSNVVSTTYPLAGADRLSGRAWGALFVLCGAIFLEAVDITMLNGGCS
jgi:hypothetical protein